MVGNRHVRTDIEGRTFNWLCVARDVGRHREEHLCRQLFRSFALPDSIDECVL